MKTARPISAMWNGSTREAEEGPRGQSMKELYPTRTAARPTKEWRSAMSSGMPVISTLRAFHMPAAAPMDIATATRAKV